MSTWTDRIIAFLALACFAAFLFIVAWWVREPDLILVLLVVVAMIAYDFWIHPWRSRRAIARERKETLPPNGA
ncbi:hypothetical protein [Afifella sp. IM 167]|uniref:hypothetical protein n=1 Tax=Afifella sp. IM 167 TaxID=2033586 RepID=UPI001CCE5645|nr:hypothetical protein [Afifella sp. IM 167]MBZ8131932.1 hypothetical protein [Afifella sp. IM 167]